MSCLTGSRSQPSKNRAARPEGCEILDAVPDGTPILLGDTAEGAITHVVAGMSPSQLIEVLAQMKAFVITHPQRARQLLLHHPQISYAVFMGLIISKIIPFDILTRMLEATRSPISPPHIRVETPNPPHHCVAPSQLQNKPRSHLPAAGHPSPTPFPQQQYRDIEKGDDMQAEDAPEICGCTVGVRQSEDIVSLWNRVDQDVRVRERIRDTLRQVLNIAASTIMEYKSNNDSMQDKSSFRNSAIDRTPLA
ncbi:hinge domain of cleavage stimulation factor subunit 2-domain-containing protein [Mycena leptocephala]|nr:hinge domain of cleavage stimulation factor subunit 2-domain-containing protein [Mycena leptocephala]